MRSICSGYLAGGLLALALTAAGAQPPSTPPPKPPAAPASSPATAPAAPSQPLLRGPDVGEPVSRTLVQLDAQGRFVRIEARPEQVAMMMLASDSMQRDEARAANGARLASLGEFLLDNLDDAIASADAQAAGDNKRVQEISRRLYDKFEPQHPRDPLMPALEKMLAPETQTELHRLVDEYWKAWIDWEVRGVKEQDRTDQTRKRTQDRLAYGMFQNDLRQAYERTLRPYRAKMQALNEIAQPTDEQKQAIRTIMLDLIRETRLNPTPEQNREAARKIYEALDDDRRQKVFESLLMRLGT